MHRVLVSGLAFGLTVAAAGAAQAGCSRSVTNRTPYLVGFSQDGRPTILVPPRGRHAIRYAVPGNVTVSVFCGREASAGGAIKPVFTARYETNAVLDRCYVEVGDGGTQPVALNNPRPGDIVVAPYGVSCPLPPGRATVSARY